MNESNFLEDETNTKMLKNLLNTLKEIETQSPRDFLLIAAGANSTNTLQYMTLQKIEDIVS